MTIHEPMETKIAGGYDVAVCGGGVAGIAAALAAARQGKKTLLVEQQFLLGGLATAGLVTVYLAICDGKGRQVSFGIAEELLRLSITHGAEARYPANWLEGKGTRTEKDKRFEVRYNPQLFAILAEDLLHTAGVDLLYGTRVAAVRREEDRISHIMVENKSGRRAYAVGSVVDATGDCDAAFLAGAPTRNFAGGNVLASWYYSVGEAGYQLNMLGFADIPDRGTTDGNRVKLGEAKRFTGLDGEELSEMTRLAHQTTYRDFLRQREKDAAHVPVTMATIPQVRMTRRIVGEYELGEGEVHTFFADSIGMVPNWKKRGPVYEVPFRSLYSARVKNLITAGRCVSADDGMWDILRVIPCCAVTGQAAGTAAAMTEDFSALDVAALQAQLRSAGVVLHEAEL